MAYLKNWTDNLFQMFFMGTSWVAVSINNIKNSNEQRNDVTQKYHSSTGMGQARYLPSLIALFSDGLLNN